MRTLACLCGKVRVSFIPSSVNETVTICHLLQMLTFPTLAQLILKNAVIGIPYRRETERGGGRGFRWDF